MSKKIAAPQYQPPLQPVVINMPAPISSPPAFTPPINLHVHPVINGTFSIPKEVPQQVLASIPWSKTIKSVFDPRALKNLNKTQRAVWCGRFVVSCAALYYIVKIARNYKNIYVKACEQLNAFIEYMNRPKPPLEVVFKAPDGVRVSLNSASHPFHMDIRSPTPNPGGSVLYPMSSSSSSIKKEKEDDDEDGLAMMGEGVQRKPSGPSSPKKEGVIGKVFDTNSIVK